jgi:hypothetical protein
MTTAHAPTPTYQKSSRRRKLIISSALVLAAGMVLVFGLSLIAGYGLNVKSFGRAIVNVIQAAQQQPSVAARQGEWRDVIFLHHSVGENLIAQGQVRESLAAAGYSFWDQDYNWKGLRDPQGNPTGYSYNVPGDNTDPDGLNNIFSQPIFGLPLNTLSGLMQHDVIAFKSCYPASAIKSDAQLEQHKAWYLKIREFMDQHPEKLFVVVTQPPLNPAETSPDAAARARLFANWLKSDEFLQSRPNVVTFDLFDRLAERDVAAPDANMLRADYRQGSDSHPTQVANQLVGPQLATFIIEAAEQYRRSQP